MEPNMPVDAILKDDNLSLLTIAKPTIPSTGVSSNTLRLEERISSLNNKVMALRTENQHLRTKYSAAKKTADDVNDRYARLLKDYGNLSQRNADTLRRHMATLYAPEKPQRQVGRIPGKIVSSIDENAGRTSATGCVANNEIGDVTKSSPAKPTLSQHRRLLRHLVDGGKPTPSPSPARAAEDHTPIAHIHPYNTRKSARDGRFGYLGGDQAV